MKWFSTDKGYGFIRRDGGGEIFVHHTDIDVEGYAALKNGETVEFEVFDSDRGPKARNLVPLGPDGMPAPRARTGESGKSRRASGRRGSEGSPGKARSGATESGMAEGKKSLAQLIRDRLGKRFPGFGA